MAKHSEFLITNGTILTSDSKDTILENGSLLVRGARIADIGTNEEVEKRHPGVSVRIDATDKVVIPGLVNVHCHSGLLRGTAENLSVFEWLARYVDPMHRVLTADEAYAASRLCYAEALKSGTTCIVDMYRHMHRCADAAVELGIRSVLVPYVADKPQYDYFESLEKNRVLIEERNNTEDGRIRVWVGLEHLAYCTKEAYRAAADMAEKYDTGIHTHGEESRDMADRITKKYGKRPVELFHAYGILGSRTLLAHCVWLTSAETDLLARTKTAVAHCPVSNMKLGSGVAPIPQYLDRGITVGLGTDGVKENNNLDLIEEMKFASLLQKVHHLNAAVMNARTVLSMATMGGARALGLADEIGSLEVGKRADITVVDLMRPHLTPVYFGKDFNVLSNLVFAARGSDVDTVVVDGRVVVRDGVLTTGNEREIIEGAIEAGNAMMRRRERVMPPPGESSEIEV